MNRNVLLVGGSRTDEDRYGVESANRVAAALRTAGYEVAFVHARDGLSILKRLTENPPDLVVPVGYGAPCEDGHICALARMANIPCAGPTPAAGGIMQDKSALSRLVEAIFPAESGIRSPSGCVLSNTQDLEEAAERIRALRLPLVIKPAWSGSSEGLLVAETHAQAVGLATTMLVKEGKVLVQTLERPVHEISCTVLDRRDGPQFLPIVELRRDDVAVMGADEKFGTEGLDRHILPARIGKSVEDKVKKAVMTLHDEVGSIGLTRTDILLLPEDQIVILELNGIPGLLQSSIACDAARAAGISFVELCVAYAESAYIPRAEPAIWLT
jgi:D-alanine-D-alanine ligase